MHETMPYGAKESYPYFKCFEWIQHNDESVKNMILDKIFFKQLEAKIHHTIKSPRIPIAVVASRCYAPIYRSPPPVHIQRGCRKYRTFSY